MKFKKLGFSTKEGLSLMNYEDGWSREYGEGGSYEVDITLNNQCIANVTEYGDGGPIDISFTNKNHKVADDYILKCLARLSKSYQEGSEYDICLDAIKNNKASDLEYACVIELLLHNYDMRKTAKKYFKKGYNKVMTLDYNYSFKQIASTNSDEETFIKHAKQKGENLDKCTISFLTEEDLTKVL